MSSKEAKFVSKYMDKFSEWYRNEYKNVEQSLDVQAETIIKTAIENDYTDDDGDYKGFIYDLIGSQGNFILTCDALISLTLGGEATEGLTDDEIVDIAEEIMNRIGICLDAESKLVERRGGSYAVHGDEDGAISVYYYEKAGE